MLYDSTLDVPLRYRCRNPHCAGKLKTPTANSRDAFCSRGCHDAYFKTHCRVCQQLMPRKTERRDVEFFATETGAMQAHERFAAILKTGGDLPITRSEQLFLLEGGIHARPCADCGCDTDALDESYMVRNEIWGAGLGRPGSTGAGVSLHRLPGRPDRPHADARRFQR